MWIAIGFLPEMDKCLKIMRPPQKKNDKNSERIDKLLDIVASQQKTIELLAQKGAAADVQGVAGKAVQG